jgi:hypothetical protein
MVLKNIADFVCVHSCAPQLVAVFDVGVDDFDQTTI